MVMTENERIVKWNEERNLIKPPNTFKEISFIIEECLEMISDIKSEDARDLAEKITKQIFQYDDKKIDPERIIDAACDIKVFATGLIRKLGYDPDIAMSEVLQEIESRKGSIQDGKFVKDKSPEAIANWYKANFSKAKISVQNP